ncbi:ABC transporter ATP-binding protein [Lentzea aerocolonigenes]|uniref:ABC transporter ATP-binding protein n=1 Tax=Lentzea aerocolonigenes TaxID=68170 RepID=A0A0F0GZE2_LENAE|nr:ABC transporter ATP-binding protein [Lentzea aerocolonigenes]
MLRLDDLNVHYGDFHALRGISLSIDEGETVAVIGANGAGKSTLLRTIAGLNAATSGEISYRGQPVDRLPAHRRVALGISLTPEGRRLFPSLTVEENLLTGAARSRPGPWSLRAVYDLFPLVEERRNRIAARLSGGEQQAVAIGRSLMSNPALLLLDEVSLGLAPVVVDQVYAALPKVVASGTTVLLVEQDVHRATAVAGRLHCLLAGRTALQGAVDSVRYEQIVAAYFGQAEAA